MDKFVIKQKAGDMEDQNISNNSANKVPKTDTKQTAADATDLKLFGPKPETASVSQNSQEMGKKNWVWDWIKKSAKRTIIWLFRYGYRVSRHHSHDKTSSVRYFSLSVRLEKRGCNKCGPLGQYESLYSSLSFFSFFCLAPSFNRPLSLNVKMGLC